jgi:hypothetical protein
MKKILLFLIFLLFSIGLFSQYYINYDYIPNRVKPNLPYLNTLALVGQGSDWGWGLRYDRNLKLHPSFGIYGAYTRGNYYWNDGACWIKNHQKYAFGGTFMIITEPSDPIFSTFSIGAVYHTFGNKEGTDVLRFNQKALNPWSMEVGCGNQFNRYAMKIRWDLLKQEVAVDFSIAFNFTKKHEETWQD